MTTISLATYVVTANRKGKSKKEHLGSINGQDLLTLLEEFLKGRSTPQNDALGKHVLQVAQFSINDREIAGQIDTGDYGFAAKLINTADAKISYTRLPLDAEMLPFFFLCHIPKDEKTGIFVFQRFKSFGIRRLFATDFGEFFATRLPEFSLKIEPIVHPKLLSGISDDGKVSRLRFRDFSIPRDVCDAFNRRIAPEDGYREYSIFVKQHLTLKDVTSRLKGTGKTALLSIPLPKKFVPKSCLLEVEINGRRRTINIQNLRKFRGYFDITSEVKFGADGHPEFDSVAEISRGLVDDLWATLRGNNAL